VHLLNLPPLFSFHSPHILSSFSVDLDASRTQYRSTILSTPELVSFLHHSLAKITNRNPPPPLILIRNRKLRGEKIEPPYYFRYPFTYLRQIPNRQENIPPRSYVPDQHLDIISYDAEFLFSEGSVEQRQVYECIEPIGEDRTEFCRGRVVADRSVYLEGQGGTLNRPGDRAEERDGDYVSEEVLPIWMIIEKEGEYFKVLFADAWVRFDRTDRIEESIMSEVGRSRSLLEAPGLILSVVSGVARANVLEARKRDQRSMDFICSMLTEY